VAPIKLQAAALLSRKSLFEKWIQEYGSDKIILVRTPTMKSGHIRWLEESDEDLIPFIQGYQGIKHVICTDIAKDGMLEGPSFDLYAKILAEAKE
jgi:phosphoribosylformimino-5-aminoimidazole carboxamide ribotide isomerase